MRLSSPSLRSVALAALVAGAGAASTGCVFTDGNDGGGDSYVQGGDPPPPAAVQQMTIDADATLTAKGGDGVGVFVEYTTGGHWHVFTACDVNQPTNPGVPCGFDVYASTLTAGSRLSNAQGESLGDKDSVTVGGDGSVHLSTETDTGLNGMTFDADPGVVVELDVYLDNAEDPHFIYWVGDKVLHQGAPSDPLDLAPSEKTATGSGTPGK